MDSTPAPVLYTRYANHGPAVPAPYDPPPLSAYDPFTPMHFLRPYEYSPEPEGYIGLQGPEIPPNAPHKGWAPKPTPRELEPPHLTPADMVIPGVQHPDGRFEPHPYFAQRAPRGPPVEPEEPEEPSKQVSSSPRCTKMPEVSIELMHPVLGMLSSSWRIFCSDSVGQIT